MLGIVTIGPSLHPTELCVRLVGPDGVDEHGEPGFVRAADTAVMAGLLKRYVIVFAVLQGLTKRDGVLDDTRARVGADAMRIGSGILEQELSVLLQRATAVVQVMNLHLNALFGTERHEFLLDRIPRERVADAQDANDEQYS